MSNDALIIIGLIAFGALVFVLYRLYQSFVEFVGYAKKISFVCNVLYKNRKSLSGVINSLDDVYKGANKINQDAVDANTALVNEVIKLREAINKFVSYMVPPETAVKELTPAAMEYRFESTYNDLIEQGIDPEIAKIKAANEELELLSREGIGPSFGIGA